MSSPTTQKTGSCLCGAIQVKITGDPFFTNLCHCYSCQKHSGVVFASIAAFQDEQIEWTFSTPDVMRTYVDGSPESGRQIKRSFCGTCGSRVKNASERLTGSSAIPTGILDGDKGDLKPQMELFCANREEWLAEIHGSKSFTGMPSVS